MIETREGRRQQGLAAEEAAARYLAAKGLHIVQRNFCCRGGEIDVVARDGDTLVFVEVRYRGTGSLESPMESVTTRKQRRLIHAASIYLQRQHSWQMPCRFDVIAITPGRIRRFRAQWIKNAFDASS
ncbi:YraN family protein [Marinobacter fonticola]|uniref:YraN family protein n=1 Tax=Marinobacter fonticola TaxID=2603215 RepID=UPI0011E83443|nr:YraN family protein [Marinobacter fonticola]